jgi:hypothetical protein
VAGQEDLILQIAEAIKNKQTINPWKF